MAGDAQLPITGKDVSVELLVAGLPIAIVDQVTSFSARATSTKIETGVLGTDIMYQDHRPKGWNGECALALNRPAAGDFIDAYHAARRSGLVIAVLFKVQAKFRDGSSRLQTYRDLTIEWEETHTPGQVSTARMTWSTGVDRTSI